MMKINIYFYWTEFEDFAGTVRKHPDLILKKEAERKGWTIIRHYLADEFGNEKPQQDKKGHQCQSIEKRA